MCALCITTSSLQNQCVGGCMYVRLGNMPGSVPAHTCAHKCGHGTEMQKATERPLGKDPVSFQRLGRKHQLFYSNTQNQPAATLELHSTTPCPDQPKSHCIMFAFSTIKLDQLCICHGQTSHSALAAARIVSKSCIMRQWPDPFSREASQKALGSEEPDL